MRKRLRRIVRFCSAQGPAGLDLAGHQALSVGISRLFTVDSDFHSMREREAPPESMHLQIFLALRSNAMFRIVAAHAFTSVSMCFHPD